MHILVEKKIIYGRALYTPMCDLSKAIAKIIEKKHFSKACLDKIAMAGIEVQERWTDEFNS